MKLRFRRNEDAISPKRRRRYAEMSVRLRRNSDYLSALLENNFIDFNLQATQLSDNQQVARVVENSVIWSHGRPRLKRWPPQC